MLTLTNILLAVLIFAVLCIPGVFDRVLTVLTVPMLIVGIGGIVGCTATLVIFIVSIYTSEPVLEWGNNLLQPLMGGMWSLSSPWMAGIFGDPAFHVDAVYLLGLVSIAAMMVCVGYFKLIPVFKYYYLRTILRQVT